MLKREVSGGRTHPMSITMTYMHASASKINNNMRAPIRGTAQQNKGERYLLYMDVT